MSYRKILVRATNWVGDAVMSLPALRALHERFPTAEISILAKPWVADLYGREIEVEFVAKLRDEEHFPTLDALVEQIHRDAAQARRILSS